VEPKKLTPKQTRFVDEYLMNGFNATAAAITAGYSKKTATIIGYENLRKPNIEQEIDRRLKAIQIKVQRRFVSHSERISDYLYKVVTGEEEANADRIRAARDLLDRAGLKVPEQRDVNFKGEIMHTDTRSLDERVKQYADVYEEIEAEETKRLKSIDESDNN
jgi:phage terminase small subunit